MTRRKFLAYNIGLAGLAIAGLYAGLVALRIFAKVTGTAPGEPLFAAAAWAGAAILAGGVLWSMAAMAVKRSRDAGLPVKPVAAGLPAAPFLDHMILAPMTPDRLGWPLDGLTPAAIVVMAGIYLFLLTVPSLPERQAGEALARARLPRR